MDAFAYDLHIHSALSPCGDEDMTPNNIANMAYLKGLDVIAVTDHNSCRNVSAVQKCGANAGVTVIPGMEVETSEEVHMVCLFKALDDAYEMEDYVTAHLPVIKNKPEIFGRQLVMDENDQITDIRENLLITATTLSVYDVFDAAKRIGAAVFPAHIDKQSYSIISNLGFIPPELKFKLAEIKDKSKKDEIVQKHRLENVKILHNSDAHYLENIAERENFLHAKGKDLQSVFECLI